MQLIIVAAIAGAAGFYAGIVLMCVLRMWDRDDADTAPRGVPDQHG